MATGDPTGGDLVSGTTNGDTLSTSTWTEREISFGAGYELISGKLYAIVVRCAVPWGYWVTSTSGYANGTLRKSTDSGSAWSHVIGYDNWFTTKASGVVKDSFNPAGDSYNNFKDTQWYAQTFTTSELYTITSVILKMRRGGYTPGTITVSIRKVEGENYDVPSKATNPSPSDTTSDVTLDQTSVSWEDGGGATSYDVYYGTESGNLTLLESGVTDTSYTIFGITDGSPFDYEKTRYWRIDAANDAGTTTGDEWSFTTITFNVPSPGPRGFGGGSGEAGDGSFGGGAIADGQMNIKTRLVAIARNKFWYEDV